VRKHHLRVRLPRVRLLLKVAAGIIILRIILEKRPVKMREKARESACESALLKTACLRVRLMRVATGRIICENNV
jgi:hypothetical protein